MSFGQQLSFGRQTSSQRGLLGHSVTSFKEVLQDAALARTATSLASVDGEGTDATPEGASWSRAGFLVANLIVGSGIFTTPYGFVVAGWLAIPYAVLASAVATWTALLLGDLLEVVDSPESLAPPTYNTIGERAFGTAFLPFFGAFGIGQCLLQGVYMISLSAQSWEASLQLPAKTMIYANAAVCLLITIIPRRFFSLIAKVGVAITLVAMGVAVASGLSLIPDDVNTDQNLYGSGLAGISGGLATVILSCGDHVCFPEIYNATGRKKASYSKGIVMGFAIFITCLLAFCIPCYLTFGDSIKPNVLTNIGLDPQGERTSFPMWLGIATNAVLAFRFLFIIPCFMPAIFAPLDCAAGKAFRIDVSDVTSVESIVAFVSTSIFKFSILLANRIIGYVVLCLCATFFESFLGALVTIVGSLFQSVNVIVIPCIAYTRLCPDKLQGRPLKTAFLWLMALVGMVWCIGGTVSGVMEVVSGKKN